MRTPTRKEALHVTRFPELAYQSQGPRNWRFIAVETGNPVGPAYPTKIELLLDLPRFALVYGCEGAR